MHLDAIQLVPSHCLIREVVTLVISDTTLDSAQANRGYIFSSLSQSMLGKITDILISDS